MTNLDKVESVLIEKFGDENAATIADVAVMAGIPTFEVRKAVTFSAKLGSKGEERTLQIVGPCVSTVSGQTFREELAAHFVQS